MNDIIQMLASTVNHSVRIMGAHVISLLPKVPELMGEIINNLGKSSEDLTALMSTTHATFEKYTL